MTLQKKIITVATVILLLGIGGTFRTYAQTLLYRSTESGQEYNFRHEIMKTENGYLIKTTNSKNKTERTYRTDPLFSLLNWRVFNPEEGTDFSVVRSGNTISLTGQIMNKKHEKEFKIDDLPWHQEWGLGLKTFIHSDKNITHFWSIDPDKSRIAKFEAKKDKIEIIDMNGQKIESTYVKLSLAGWMKAFWSGGEMWFRNSDGILILSKMNSKAPEDKTQLIQENEDRRK